MLELSFRTNIKQLEKELDAFVRKQLPFATAQALTATAKAVQLAERENMAKVLDRPTPFTLNSIRVKAARKNDLEAIVFVQDIAAAYLEPFETGGMHKLIGKGITWWNPKHVQLDQYGNVPKSAIKALLARPDIFIGRVKSKSGAMIDGVWWRSSKRDDPKLRGRRKGLTRITPTARADATGSLVLIARFGDALPVKQRLGYAERAKLIIYRVFDKEMGKALGKAIASAR